MEIKEAQEIFDETEKHYDDMWNPFDVDSACDLFEYGFVRWLEIAMSLLDKELKKWKMK